MLRSLRSRWIGPLLAVLVAGGALQASAAQGRSAALGFTLGDLLEAPDGTARTTLSEVLPWAAFITAAPDDASGTQAGLSAGLAARPAVVATTMLLVAASERRCAPVPLRHLLCVYRL
jgi:hypothetical protein